MGSQCRGHGERRLHPTYRPFATANVTRTTRTALTFRRSQATAAVMFRCTPTAAWLCAFWALSLGSAHESARSSAVDYGWGSGMRFVAVGSTEASPTRWVAAKRQKVEQRIRWFGRVPPDRDPDPPGKDNPSDEPDEAPETPPDEPPPAPVEDPPPENVPRPPYVV